MSNNRSILFVGSHLLHFPQLPSTNLHALELLAKSRPPEGTVISTYHQTGGRGQYGTSWESEAGNSLAYTTILYPKKVPARRQFLLNQVAALALVDLLRPLVSGDLLIKWPNDILLNHRKVAGILIQNALSGHQLQHSVVGIGLNVNQRAFPAHLPRATSLQREEGRTFELEDIRSGLSRCLQARYLQLRNGQEAALEKDYESQLYGRSASVRLREPGGQEWAGQVLGVTAAGLLRVLPEEGNERQFQMKEVAFLLPGA